MALTDGIREVYRIRGVGEAASGYAFSRLRTRRKQSGHHSQDEHPRERPEEESTGAEKDSEKHIDVEA